MPKTPHPRRPRVMLAVLAAVALHLSGCGVLVTTTAALKKKESKPKDRQQVIVTEAREDSADAHINRFALMALFAKTVYRKNLSKADREHNACEYLNPGVTPDSTGMPRAAGYGHWSRWAGTPDIRACFNASGLAYETYIHTQTDGKTVDEAVISFRGTENDGIEKAWHDWGTNFSALFGFAPPQYVLAQQHVPAVLAALHTRHPDIKIYVTGHSLGGGLAQQIAYLSDQDKHKVEATFTFDPSPVTNWSQLQLDGAVKTADPVIYRIYHAKEGLSYVRNITSRFNSRRVGRSDYEFYFQPLEAMAAHEMAVIACHMANRIQGDFADHHYPKSFAQTVINPAYRGEGQKPSDEHPICPTSVKLE